MIYKERGNTSEGLLDNFSYFSGEEIFQDQKMPKKGKGKSKEEELWNGDEEENALEEKMKKLATDDGAAGKDKKKKKKSKLAQLAELMAAEDNEEGGVFLFCFSKLLMME